MANDEIVKGYVANDVSFSNSYQSYEKIWSDVPLCALTSQSLPLKKWKYLKLAKLSEYIFTNARI